MRREVVRWGGAFLIGSLVSGCDQGEPASPSSTTLQAQSADTGWKRTTLGDMPAQWQNRDGAGMVQLGTGRILMIGGWSPYDPWGPKWVPGVGGGDRITNEVWKSDDLGATWQLLLPHVFAPPEKGPDARFPPGHAIGVVTYDGHAVVMGSDGSVEIPLLGDVWQESNNGTTWTRVARGAPTLNRILFMCANYKGAIYVMGGQSSAEDPTTAFNDVYRSYDGGVTWTQLANAPWSPRGMVYRPAEHDGKLVVVGGGRYADIPYAPDAYNGVFAFDGTTWETVLPDGHQQFEPSFYNPVISLNGRLWLFDGYDPFHNIEFSRAMASDDNGSTWTAFPGGAGGSVSHADTLTVASGRIIRISGSLNDRAIWAFAR